MGDIEGIADINLDKLQAFLRRAIAAHLEPLYRLSKVRLSGLSLRPTGAEHKIEWDEEDHGKK